MFRGSNLLEYYWTLPEEEILAKLGTSPKGLSSIQAEQKLGITRAGALHNGDASWAGLLWSQFNNPIVWLLSIAAVLSYHLAWDIKSIAIFMTLFGMLGTISDLIAFYFLLRVVHADIAIFQTTWFIVSIMTGLLIMLTVRTQRPFFLSQPGR